jgi:hypothetical protein
MKRWMTIAWAMLLIAMAVACNRAPNTQAEVQAIQSTEKQWNQDYVSKDADKIAAYYADDAVLMAPGMRPPPGGKASAARSKACSPILRSLSGSPPPPSTSPTPVT